MSHKIGFLVSEFLPTKEFIKTSLNNLQKDDLKVYFLPIYSPNKKSNNKLLFKVLRDTSLNYIIYKIFDTLYINFIRKLKKDNIKYFVKKNNIAYENLDLDFNLLEEKIKDDNVDILVLLTNQYIPNNVLKSPNIITVNMHLAKIPEYGGLFNQFWMMLNDEKYGYATIHIASTRIDAGQVLLEDRLEINYEETLMELYYKTAQLGGKLLYRFLSNFNDYYDPGLIIKETEPTNRGLPNRIDMKNFRKKGFKLFKLSTLKKVT
tara:strand:- start:9505 stop:10293 length:789 start_codon:yes stop_codon:yes gene_type:complete